MKPKPQPQLDTLIFEVRYAYGHLYFDRCGQTIIDIQRECDGWVPGQVDVQTGYLERPDKGFRVGFSSIKFDFTADRADNEDIRIIAKEASTIWNIIQANLGLSEFPRIGCRLQYLLPTESIDEAERMLKSAKLNVLVPDALKNSGYKLKTRQITVVLSREDMEYRIILGTVTRVEGIDPSALIKGDPRALPKSQQKVRIETLKRLSEYRANPMYAVQLDIDCVKLQPETVGVEEYIKNQTQIVRDDFLQILEKL
jgi:hypothetical protein